MVLPRGAGLLLPRGAGLLLPKGLRSWGYKIKAFALAKSGLLLPRGLRSWAQPLRLGLLKQAPTEQRLVLPVGKKQALTK